MLTAKVGSVWACVGIIGLMSGACGDYSEDIEVATGALNTPVVGYPQGFTCGIGYIVPWQTVWTASCQGSAPTVTARHWFDGNGENFSITTGAFPGYTNMSIGDRGLPNNFGFYAQELNSSTGNVAQTDWLLLPKGTACGFSEHCNAVHTCMGKDPQVDGCPNGWQARWGGDASAPGGCNFVWCEYQDPHNVCPDGSSCAFNDQPAGIACGIVNHSNPDVGNCLGHSTGDDRCPAGWTHSYFLDSGNSSGHGIGWCTKL